MNVKFTFQFHKGTIRTIDDAAVRFTLPKFQFHKGTIRTNYLHPDIAMQLHFNSIKVQLEPEFLLHAFSQ